MNSYILKPGIWVNLLRLLTVENIFEPKLFELLYNFTAHPQKRNRPLKNHLKWEYLKVTGEGS